MHNRAWSIHVVAKKATECVHVMEHHFAWPSLQSRLCWQTGRLQRLNSHFGFGWLT